MIVELVTGLLSLSDIISNLSMHFFFLKKGTKCLSYILALC